MKSVLVALFVAFSAHGLTTIESGKIADAIYKIEGGNKTQYPYGVMSIKTHNPRQVCLNTINNTFARWRLQNKELNFFTYLANRYCPPSADPQGNKNWKNNIVKMLGVNFVSEINKQHE